jgi:MerR family redox-sensitive transcriptional activator SoxR
VIEIGELARRTQTSVAALRYYEKLGLVPPPPRTAGRRSYAPEVADRVALVKLCQEVGFSLAEIRQLLDSGGDRSTWRSLVEEKVGELDLRIAQVTHAKVFLEHFLRCPSEDPLTCPRFRDEVHARLAPEDT